MRLLIIGSMNGQIGAASKIAFDHGAKVSHVPDPSTALELARSGQSADLVMIDVELDIAAFIKSLKDEWLRRLIIPLCLETMRHDLSAYTSWFNEHRPHQALDGCTPREIYEDRVPLNQARRFEPRAEWPADPDDSVSSGRLTLSVTFHERRRHLPIIELKLAA